MKTLIALAALAATSTFTETFDEPLDAATWRLGTLDEIVTDGTDSYLRNRELDAAVPEPTGLAAPFLGDYRFAGVTSLGIDVNVFAASIGVDPSRTLSLVLASDDCAVIFTGNRSLPRVGSGWHSYDFRVPSAKTRMPPGWSVGSCAAGISADEAWNRVITNVSHVTFPFSAPGVLWYFQIWDVGIDNVRISSRP